MKILILGAGAFGIPVMRYLSSKSPYAEIFLYEKDDATRASLKSQRRSPYFYTEYIFPDNITIIDSVENIVSSVDVIFFIIPNQFILSSIQSFASSLRDGIIFVNFSKGINNQTLQTVSDILEEKLSGIHYEYAVLSGGMIAAELYEGKPLGADIGVTSVGVGKILQELLTSNSLSINILPNYKQVELIGAFKNVIALYSGYYEGMGYGFSSVGLYICLIMQEIEKLILQMIGGETNLSFSSFSYGGDIIATCFGNSRNRYLGRLIGSGMSIDDALLQLKSENKHAEGYETLKGIKGYIKTHGGEYPEIQKMFTLFRV